MKIEVHMAKAERFAQSVEKLDPAEDFEAVMWGRMHVCSNWMNAALHAKGVIPENKDVAHTWYLFEHGDHDFLEANIDEETRLALTELTVFESLRTTHVRGPATYGSEVCKLSDRAYNHIKEFTEKAIAAISPSA